MVNNKMRFLNELQLKEMVTTQLSSWELTLRQKGLMQNTIDRKINNVGLFYHYMTVERLKDKNKKLSVDKINNLAYEIVRDGFFSEDNIDNYGCYSYRVNIYNNIRTGINYVYEDYFKDRIEVIKPLTVEQKEVLDDISKNKWFRTDCFRSTESVNDNLQVKIIEDLGIKIYFDEDNKPYALSHELAECIKVENKHIREKLTKLISFKDSRNFDHPLKHSDFSTLEDEYVNSQNKKQATTRIYKDMLILYFMDISAQGSKKDNLLEFKMKYIDAFNYIESEYKRLLIENAQLKESFLNMYNEVRKRNRDLLVLDHNKKCKKVS